MSEENVKVAQAAVAAWNAQEMESLRALYHPEAIMRSPKDWPEPGPFVGRDAIMQQFQRARESWARDSLDLLTDFRGAGDRVLARVAWRGAGHGPEASFELTLVYTVRAGLIHGVEYFWDHGDALEAAGLNE